MEGIIARMNFAKNCAITTHTSSIVYTKKWEKLQGVMIRKDGTWDTKSSISNFNQNSMIIGKHALQYPMIQIKLKISRLPVEISQYITHGTSYLIYNILKSFLIGMGSPGA